MTEPSDVNGPPEASESSSQGGGGFGTFSAGSGSDETFRGWKLVRRFPAKGGESDVFLVEKDGQQRVLKLYRYGITPKTEVFERISRLARQHPPLFVGLHEFGMDQQSGCFFEFEEFIVHGTLADLQEKRKFSEVEIESLVRQTAGSLTVLHDEGILHLDLKPANILVRHLEPLVAVLSDFGISSVFDAELSKKLTQAKGTSLYQSPESITGVVVPKSDWWSLGIMTLELLLGRHPFEGLQRQVILYQLTTQGVEIPGHLAARWQNLLMGLLTRNPDRRWGADQVKKWLDGKTLETFYREENAPKKEDVATSANDGSSSWKKLQIPLSFMNKPCHALEELLGLVFSSPQAWEEGRVYICRGKVAAWLEENVDTERSSQFRRLMDEENDPDLLVFRTGYYFKPDLPFGWRGRSLEGDQLRALLERVGGAGSTREDEELFESLQNEKLFSDFKKLTGQTLGKLDQFVKFLQGAKGTALEGLSSKERAQIFSLAMGGGFAGNQALPAVRLGFEDRNLLADALFSFVQLKGFQAFAQKGNLWQSGDAELWAMSGKLYAQRDPLKECSLAAFFSHVDMVTGDVRKNPPVRDFLVRLFGRPDVDLGLVKQIQTHAGSFPWVEPLVRGLYHFPAEEKLESCLAVLIVRASLKSKWASLNAKYLLPTLLEEIHGGFQAPPPRDLDPVTAPRGEVSKPPRVTPDDLRFAREILDHPEVLPAKTEAFRRLRDLEAVAATPPFEHNTIEYLGFLKREQSRMSGTTRRSCLTVGFEWGAVFFVLLVLGAIAVPSGSRGGRTQAREKSCYANMRVILGAIEMYNMDNAVMMENLDFTRLLGQNLYLKSQPVCPQNGTYSGNALNDVGRIVCSSHGTVE